MKQMVSVRSNPLYTQNTDGKEFILYPSLELVIIHTEGKNYKLTKKGIESNPKLAEIRLQVTPKLLESLINDLIEHQKKLQIINENAEQINELVKHIMSNVDNVSLNSKYNK